MTTDKNCTSSPEICIRSNGYAVERVSHFRYLRSLVAANGDVRNEKQQRMSAANTCYFRLLNTDEKQINIKLKNICTTYKIFVMTSLDIRSTN